MPLFVEKKETAKYIHFYQKKFANLKTSIIYLIVLVFIIPFIALSFSSNIVLILVLFGLYLLLLILAIWFAFEKAYYSTTYPRKFIRQGKKVVYEKDGVKIYK